MATPRGGAAISVRAVTGKPIKFTGVGEKLTDIEPFHPDRMASRILGMGDVLSLIEKRRRASTKKRPPSWPSGMAQNRFTLTDFLDQMQQMKNMGSMQDILAMLPGGSKLSNLQIDEKALARTEAIILSMTPAERNTPEIINASRKKRIAKGCGLQIQDVNRLLNQYEQSRQAHEAAWRRPGRQKAPRHGGFKLPF